MLFSIAFSAAPPSKPAKQGPAKCSADVPNPTANESGPTAEAPHGRRIERLGRRIEQVTFFSDILKRPKRFCVVRPDDKAQKNADWPVLFLLHGRGRHERSLIDDPECRAALLQADFAIVLPDGDDGWYIDSPVQPAERYAAYLSEVIAHAEALYPLSRQRTKRGLSGWSMGGYGCVRFAQTHADEFGLVASMIGLLDFPRDGLPPGQSYSVPADRFGTDRTVWRAFNPLHQADTLRETSVLLVTANQAFDRTMNENFHARLLALNIEHEWRILRGGHTFDVVQQALPLVLRFTKTRFAAQR